MPNILLAVALLGTVYASWKNHRANVVLLAALLPTYLLRFDVFGVPTNFFEATISIAAAMGVCNPIVRGQWREAIARVPRVMAVWVGLFVAAAFISTAISPHLQTSLGILKSWIIIPILFGFMVFSLDPRYALRATRYLILSGTVMALLGISQLGTLDRVQGIYDVPNSLALFLAPLIVLAVAPAISVSPALPVTGYTLRVRSLASLLMFLALLATQSLAGILTVVVVSLFVLASSKHYPLQATHYRLPVVVMLLALTAIVAVPKIEYLLQPTSSAYVRLQLWDISRELIFEHPFLGIGLGTFEPAYQEKLHNRFRNAQNNPALPATHYPLPEFIFRDPHNWVLSFWLNTGLLGLISFIGLHVCIFTRTFKHWLLTGHWKLGTGVLGALAVLLIFGLVDTIYWKNDLASLHTLLVALAASARMGPPLGRGLG